MSQVKFGEFNCVTRVTSVKRMSEDRHQTLVSIEILMPPPWTIPNTYLVYVYDGEAYEPYIIAYDGCFQEEAHGGHVSNAQTVMQKELWPQLADIARKAAAENHF